MRQEGLSMKNSNDTIGYRTRDLPACSPVLQLRPRAPRLSWNLNFLDRFSKIPQLSDLMKIRVVGAELFHADRQTDMTKLVVTFRNFANAPNQVNR